MRDFTLAVVGLLLTACASEPLAKDADQVTVGAGVDHAWVGFKADGPRLLAAPDVTDAQGTAFETHVGFGAPTGRVLLRAQYLSTEHEVPDLAGHLTIDQTNLYALWSSRFLGGDTLGLAFTAGPGIGYMVVDGDQPLPFDFHRALQGGLAMGFEVQVAGHALVEVFGSFMANGDLGDTEGFTSVVMLGGGIRF